MGAAVPKGAAVRLLLVEDDPDHAEIVRRAFPAPEGHRVVHAPNGREGLELLASEAFDLCVLDYRLPDWEGVQLCREVRQRGFKGKVLLVTTVRSESLVRRALEAGADRVVFKGREYGRRLADEARALGVGAP